MTSRSRPKRSSDCCVMHVGELKWSGRKDLNLRPPGPEPGALARLRYAPTVKQYAGKKTPAETPRIAQDMRAHQRPYSGLLTACPGLKPAKILYPDNKTAGEEILSGGKR